MQNTKSFLQSETSHGEIPLRLSRSLYLDNELNKRFSSLSYADKKNFITNIRNYPSDQYSLILADMENYRPINAINHYPELK